MFIWVKHYFGHFSGSTVSFCVYELLIANINWYCRLLPEERMYGQGTAVDVILAVRLCLPFIWTFSCLSFLTFVCFLFGPPVVWCHNKVSYIPSSNSFLILSPYGWFCCLCFHSIIRLPMDRAKIGHKACYSTLSDVGLGVFVWFWHGVCFRKYVRRCVSSLRDVSNISLLMQVRQFASSVSCIALCFICLHLCGHRL